MSYFNIKRKKKTYKKRPKAIREIDRFSGNNISSHQPDAHLMKSNEARDLPLPCGSTYGPKWGYLINHLQAYKIARKNGNWLEMNDNASAIHNIRAELGLPDSGWPPVVAEYDTRREQTFY